MNPRNGGSSYDQTDVDMNMPKSVKVKEKEKFASVKFGKRVDVNYEFTPWVRDSNRSSNFNVNKHDD